MQIKQITPINFGYNKQLEKQLNERLKKDPDKSEAKLIALTNDFCNKTEKALRKWENEDKPQEILQWWYTVFICTKESLMQLIDAKYPDLKFQEREVKSYEKELHKMPAHIQENNWRSEIATDYYMDKEIDKNNADIDEPVETSPSEFDEIEPNHYNFIVNKYMNTNKNTDTIN